ncbi:hypothetical protein [Planktotalea sp.]|uniref:hypothetical protein n=1 Tax=Planktotalea sp. TaxID=2029877 RepID=UPI003299CEE9
MILTDDDLRSYLNGASGTAQRVAIEAALAQGDQDIEDRLRALDPLSQEMLNAFTNLPDEARLDDAKALINASAHRRPSNKWAALAAALVLGLGVGWTLQGTNGAEPTLSTDWRHHVAQYQALYVPQTVAQTDNPRLSEQFDVAEAALGREFTRDALRSFGELDLVRVQVLGYEGQTLIQMAYRDAEGRPFALCLMKGQDSAGGTEELAGLAAHSWSEDGLRLILIGGEDIGFVEKHANIVQDLPFS